MKRSPLVEHCGPGTSRTTAAMAQGIQYAASKFVDGGRPGDIWRLVNTSNRREFVESPGVVPRLVEFVVYNQPVGEGRDALKVLSYLMEVGRVAQDAIAFACNGAIFAWLAGSVSYAEVECKRNLITNLTANHSANAALLDAARGGGASLIGVVVTAACAGAAALVELIRTSISTGDTATAALAMHVLFNTQREDGATPALPRESIPVLTSIMNWSSHITDDTVSTIQDQAVFLLVKQLHVDEARVALTQSPFGLIAHLNVIKNSSTDARSRLLAVLRLTQLVKEQDSVARSIVEQGGIRALIDVLVHNDGGILGSNVREQAARLLGTLAVCERSIVHLHNDGIKNLQLVANCDGTAAVLVSLLEAKSPAIVQNLPQRLGELIPFLVARLDNDVDQKGGFLLASLTALEHLSRVRANQRFFQRDKCVERLTKLLRASAVYEVKTAVARILANISYQNRDMSELIVECDAAEELLAMMNSTNVKLQTVALMALRNLTNNDTNRIRIGLPYVISRLVEMVKTSKTVKQREAAVAVLGNLAHLAANRHNIVSSGGVAAVLAFIPQTTTPQQLETAAGALWVFTSAVDGILSENNGIAVIQEAMLPYQPHQIPWASRLVERFQASSASQ